MTDSALKAFLSELIDYAGLFPPAQLSMQRAVENYFKYRNSPNGWIISRFICPASRLNELETSLASWEPEISSQPLRLSVTCSTGTSIDEFFSILEKEFDNTRKFQESYSTKVKIELLELKIPRSLFSPNSTTSQVKSFLDDLVDFIDDEFPWQVRPFLEPQLDDKWENFLTTLFGGFAIHYDDKALWTRKNSLPPGIKIRCGGTFLSRPPSAAQLARILSHCSMMGITFKATAGLHHPLPHFNQQQNVMEHGFINVFLAAVLAFTQNVPEEILRSLLQETDKSKFIITDHSVGWNDHVLAAKEVKKARQKAISFGSCDFIEPITELQHLDFL